MGGNAIISGRQLSAAPAAYRGGTALTGADSNSWGSAPLDVAGADASAQPTRGNATLVVSPRFSVASAYCTVAVGLWHYDGTTWTFLGLAGEVTAYASADQQDANSKYVGTDMLPFSVDGATHYEVRVPSVSSGNVVLVPHLVGPAPQGPESL